MAIKPIPAPSPLRQIIPAAPLLRLLPRLTSTLENAAIGTDVTTAFGDVNDTESAGPRTTVAVSRPAIVNVARPRTTRQDAIRPTAPEHASERARLRPA